MFSRRSRARYPFAALLNIFLEFFNFNSAEVGNAINACSKRSASVAIIRLVGSCGAGAEEAHGGAKADEGTTCGAGGALARPSALSVAGPTTPSTLKRSRC